MSKKNLPLTDNAIDDGVIEENPQLALAALASMNNKGAIAQIYALVEPLIAYQTDCFCKRFCGRNASSYQCSLANPVIDKSSPATTKTKNKRVCEWGSASRHWMIDYLINKQRLLKFTNRHGDSLYDYFFQIINSLTFFQRWKDWRFGGASTPLAIQNMGPAAVTVFKGLAQQRKLRFIADQAGLKLSHVECLAEEIIRYLSDTHTCSALLSGSSSASTTSELMQEINEQDESKATALSNQQGNHDGIKSENLNTIWNELSATEQFVIEAIVINQQTEEMVLYALKIMDIRLKEGVLPEDTTVEMLHVFKTDSLLKLVHHL